MKITSPLKYLPISVVCWLSLVLVILLSGIGHKQSPVTGIANASIAMQQEPAIPGVDPGNYSTLPDPDPAHLAADMFANASPEETIPLEASEIAIQTVTGQLEPGESLELSLSRSDIGDGLRSAIINAFAGILDFSRLRPGDRYTIGLDGTGELQYCDYEVSPVEIFSISRDDTQLVAAKKPVQLEKRTVQLAGTVTSSLFSSVLELKEQSQLVYAFADIFASKIDFNTETQPGDRFAMVVEKYYKDDSFVGYGRILMGRYETQGQVLEGYFFKSAESPGSYFDAAGQGMGTSFIRSPVPLGRVTSKFTLQRLHPVNGTIKPHLGVDLAAPTGTPIMATADGRIEFLGWKGGYGNAIVLKHPGGYKTYYGHLSRFKNSLKIGSLVKQKDIIGYVGSTGLSTGPHLDYRLQVNGVFKNPFGVKFKAKTILAGRELESFSRQKSTLALMLALQPGQFVLASQQITVTDENPVDFL